MNNLGVLFHYEWKKIWQKKITWIMGGIMILSFLYNSLCFLIPQKTIHTDSEGNVQQIQSGGYREHVKECENARKLNGKKIDETLLKQVWLDYDNEKYDVIKDIMTTMLVENLWSAEATDKAPGLDADQNPDQVTEDVHNWYLGLEEAAADNINTSVGLTAAERQYWLAQDAKVEKPLTYTYAGAWSEILWYMQDIILWITLICAVCLSGVFSEEKRKKTDLLILSTKNGKNPVFFAKLLAGIAFAMLCFLILYGIILLRSFLFFGTEGFSAQIQLFIPRIPFAASMGQMVLLLLGITILAGILTGILCTVLSECFGSSIAVLAVVGGSTFLSLLIEFPAEKRIPAQMQDLLPVRLLVSYFTLTDLKTVSLFGLRMPDWQFAFVLYPLLATLLLLFGWWKYSRHHAGSR